jgi:apolipoprotein D and lipocalin family protein
MSFLKMLFVEILLGIYQPTDYIPAVSNFDINQYLGTWYEIARYDHWFEKGQKNVKTEYILKDNIIIVKNQGELNNKLKTIEGVARFKDKNNVGWLEVSFFKPIYGDYKIIYLDENYENVIITGDSKSYLWILSRNQKLTN